MGKLHDILSSVGTCSGLIAWNAQGGADLIFKVSTIICAANLLLSWALKVYARLKAVRDGKKSAEDAAKEFEDESKGGGKGGKDF